MIDPKTLSVEERAIVEETVTANVSFDGLACDLFWDKCYEFAIQRILARRALFGESASEPAYPPCPNCGVSEFCSHEIMHPDGPPTWSCQPASETAKVECPNCGKVTSIEHKYADGRWICASPQPKVAMTEELEDLLDSIMSFADVDPDTQVKQIWRRKVAAVRAQAARVKLPKVREALGWMKTMYEPGCQGHTPNMMVWEMVAAALAELDAAEGVETKEGK